MCSSHCSSFVLVVHILLVHKYTRTACSAYANVESNFHQPHISCVDADDDDDDNGGVSGLFACVGVRACFNGWMLFCRGMSVAVALRSRANNCASRHCRFGLVMEAVYVAVAV